MPSGALAGDGVTAEENPIAGPGSRSRRFLSGLSIFQSKRSATSSSTGATGHRRGGSLDIACLGGGSSFGHWHTYKFCEQQPLDSTQCRQPSVRPKHEDQTDGRDADSLRPSPSVTSRSWLRIVGRFGGKKLNRVRGTDSPGSSSSQAKDPQAQAAHTPSLKKKTGVAAPIPLPTSHCPDEAIILKPTRTWKRRSSDSAPQCHHVSSRVVRECEAVVANLRCTKGKEQGMVAAEARLLARDYPTARATLATLGAVAPLVAMLDSPSSTFSTHTALKALYTLAIGNDVNKAAIVDAGAIPKMLNLVQTADASAVVANLLSLSALDRNKSIIGASGAIAHLVQGLKLQTTGLQSLRALYNLSLAQSNIKLFVEADASTVLVSMEILKSPSSSPAAEKALAVVGNMVAVPVGRNLSTPTLDCLIGVLGWGGSKCQERAAYILMVIAHHSYGHRQTMVAKGAIPALLEVSLLGTALAQKRAVRILECLREDRRPNMSAPLGGQQHSTVKDHHQYNEFGTKLIVIDHMVQQSLEQNLQRIVRRANLPTSTSHHMMRADHHSSSLSGSCSSSKSLPF